jgi:hypothetical protein
LELDFIGLGTCHSLHHRIHHRMGQVRVKTSTAISFYSSTSLSSSTCGSTALWAPLQSYPNLVVLSPTRNISSDHLRLRVERRPSSRLPCNAVMHGVLCCCIDHYHFHRPLAATPIRAPLVRQHRSSPANTSLDCAGVQTVQSLGKKVLISIGGASGSYVPNGRR